MLERGDCTLENWLDPPSNRWSLWHVREMTRTACVRRGTGPVRDLPVEPDWLGESSFDHLSEGQLAVASALTP